MQKIFLLLLTVAFGLNLSAQDVSLPCDTTNCSLLKYDGNDDGMVNYEDFLEMLGAYGSADVDGDCIEDSQDDCVEDGCGVCDGPGPTIQVVDTIVFLSDSTFIEVLNEWYVFEVPDTTFTYVCPLSGCTDSEAGNYNPEAVIEDGSCVYGPSECGGVSTVMYDGYTYDLVAIGDQCWFTEHLRNEHYANGDVIPGDLSDGEWSGATEGAQVVYNNDVSNLVNYGRLYNWYAVDDARGLCPSNWHVPTDEEFMTLEMELGMSEAQANGTGNRGTDQGTQMKSSPEDSPAWNGTNTSGFSGFVGGLAASNGSFVNGGNAGYMWSATPSGANAWQRLLSGGSTGVWRGSYNSQRNGLSVRCVRD